VLLFACEGKSESSTNTTNFRMDIEFFSLKITGYRNERQWLDYFGETCYKNNDNINPKDKIVKEKQLPKQ